MVQVIWVGGSLQVSLFLSLLFSLLFFISYEWISCPVLGQRFHPLYLDTFFLYSSSFLLFSFFAMVRASIVLSFLFLFLALVHIDFAGWGESGFICWRPRGSAFVSFLFYVNVS